MKRFAVCLSACLLLICAHFSPLFAQTAPQRRSFELSPNEIEPSIRQGSMRVSTLTGAPLALYGPGFAVSSGTPEEMARQYLSARADVLQLRDPGLSDLTHTATRNTTYGGYVVRFIQHVSGIPVYQSEIAVTIDGSNVVRFVMNGYKPDLGRVGTTPTVSSAAAQQTAYQHIGLAGTRSNESSNLLIYHNQGTTRLAYEISVLSDDPQGHWQILVDAQTGELFKAVDRAYYYKPHTDDKNDDDKKSDPNKPETSPSRMRVDGTGNVFIPEPLASANTTYGATGFADGGDADTPQLTGELMSVTLRDLTFDGTDYHLVGPWAAIQEIESPAAGLFEQPGTVFNFTRSERAFEAVNTYYHIDTIMRYINETLGLNIRPFSYAGGVHFDPHGLNGGNNAHYVSGAQFVSFGEGIGNVVDTGEDGEVVTHEIGHGLHDWVTNGGLSQVNGLSEGIGDYTAGSYTRGLGILSPGDPQYNQMGGWGLQPLFPGRILNTADHYPEDLNGSVHHDGMMWAASMIQIWDAIGQTKSDMAHWEGIGMTTSGANQPDAAQAVLVAANALGYTADLNTIFTIFQNRGYNPILPEQVAPAQISDLAITSTDKTSMDLTWTASGDDGNTGTADVYDVRYSTSPITNDTEFNAAMQATGEPAPQPNGSTENFTLTGLVPNTLYYVALKVRDESGNNSPLSNNPSDMTDTEAPLLTVSVSPSTVPLGGTASVTLTAFNHTGGPLNSVALSVPLPAGTTFVPGSAGDGGGEAGGTVSFPAVPALASGGKLKRTFSIQINSAGGPTTFTDDMESGPVNWDATRAVGDIDWILQAGNAHSPTMSWFAQNTQPSTDFYLTQAVPVVIGPTTELRFWHHYNTEADWDGGVVEISTDGGETWTDLGPNMTANGYNSTIEVNPASAISGRMAFSGNSGGYLETVVDLSSFDGSMAQVRFRFAADGLVFETGWWVDDVTINNLGPSINGTAMVQIDGGDTRTRGFFGAVQSAYAALNAKVFLHGAYDGGSMRTDLQSNGLIPANQPYNAAPWNYAGTEALANPPATMVDWILVHLRATTDGPNLDTRAAVLHSDGTITDLSGGPLIFSNVAAGDYYVVFDHRNHVMAMTASAVTLNAAAALFDFTLSAAGAFGNDLYDLSGGSLNGGGPVGPFALYGGDATTNDAIVYIGAERDQLPIITVLGTSNLAGTVPGYLNADMDLDGEVVYIGATRDQRLIIEALGTTNLAGEKSTNVPE